MKKTILITGATDGLGKLVATQVAKLGHHVLVHGRNPAKGKAVVDEIKAATGNADVEYYNADLASLAEVRRLSDEILSTRDRLDVLVNNAGIGPRAPGSARQLSKDGHELFFAVNYLAGYLLTVKLLPLLSRSVPARIINVASIGQLAVNFGDVMMHNDYDDAKAYRQSKLAQILFTFSLAEQLETTGITVNCLHPATLMNTKMVHDSDYFPGSMATVEQGADALMQLVLSADLAGVTGRYFDGLGEAKADPQAYDLDARRQLLTLSEQLVGEA